MRRTIIDKTRIREQAKISSRLRGVWLNRGLKFSGTAGCRTSEETRATNAGVSIRARVAYGLSPRCSSLEAIHSTRMHVVTMEVVVPCCLILISLYGWVGENPGLKTALLVGTLIKLLAACLGQGVTEGISISTPVRFSRQFLSTRWGMLCLHLDVPSYCRKP